MTVGELRKKLEGIDPKTSVMAYKEDGQGTHYFDVSDASVHAGTPIRHASGNVGMRFDHNGPTKWLLIQFEED